jgi:hypothetical protein
VEGGEGYCTFLTSKRGFLSAPSDLEALAAFGAAAAGASVMSTSAIVMSLV